MTAVVLCAISAVIGGVVVWLLCSRMARRERQDAERQLAGIERALRVAGSGVYSYYPRDDYATYSRLGEAHSRG